MAGIIYDEVSEFLKSNKDDSDEAMKQSLHNWMSAIDFTSVMNPAQREAQMRRETFLKYQAACLHGERSFYITYAPDVREVTTNL